MNREQAIEMLREDEHYYGEHGRKYLSNSDIGSLLNNPLDFKKQSPNNPNFVVGGYFHTQILEPQKLEANYPISASTSRNSKAYREEAGDDILILQKEVDNCNTMKARMLENEMFHKLIYDGIVEYEVPGICDLNGYSWKGKADIINHTYKVIVDLKTTGQIRAFNQSANKFNYDSQAYIYQKMFGYELVFLAVDKTTHQMGLFDCSDAFLLKGEQKVLDACKVYEDYFGIAPEKELNQYYINKTLS